MRSRLKKLISILLVSLPLSTLGQVLISSDSSSSLILSSPYNYGIDTVKVNFFYYRIYEKYPILRVAAGYMITKGFAQGKLYTCDFEKVPKNMIPVAIQFPLDRKIYE